MSRWIVPAIGFVAVSCALGAPSKANEVLFFVEGEVTRVYDPEGHLNPSIVPGSPIWAEYYIETLAPDHRFLDPDKGYYPDGVAHLNGQVGGVSFSLSGVSGLVEIENPLANIGGEKYLVTARASLGGLPLTFIHLLTGSSMDVFPDEHLPTHPFPFQSFGVAQIGLADLTEVFPINITAELTRFVPEPGVGCLLAFLLLSCSRWHRMR